MSQRHVGPLDVHLHDAVQVEGKLRKVIDIRTIDGGTGRLLIFDDGTKHRMRSGDLLPAQRS